MRDEGALAPPAGPGSGGTGAAALPDIDEETYPFEMVQHLLDEAAYFNLYSIPEDGDPVVIRAGGAGDCIGFRIGEALRRFEVRMQPPDRDGGLRASNVVGEKLGRFRHRWLVCPADFEALPGREPPATPLCPDRQQRFVMLDSVCELGENGDGFRGFGTGTTFPAAHGTLLVAAVGNVMEGYGRLSGLDATYVYCGTLSETEGFRGSMMLRVMDPAGVLRTENMLPAIEPIAWPEPGVTYLVLRGQKKDRTAKTIYRFGPDGQVDGLRVSQQLWLVEVDAAVRGRGGLRSVKTVGPMIGTMGAEIAFNLLNPGAPGSAVAPIPFQSFNEYTFQDRSGAEIGRIVADGGEGRTFNMELAGAPGQRALRFGGFGPVVDGSGVFSGIEGLMADNSVVGIFPHAIVTFYVIRIADPRGRLRTAG